MKTRQKNNLENFTSDSVLPLILSATLALTQATVASGQSYRVLRHFNGNDGWNPRGDLVRAGTRLYGTTAAGGSYSHGVVFSVNTDGSGFTVLKSFNGGDGDAPVVGLFLSENPLYGTTDTGGSNDRGTVFRLNTDGSAFTVLHSFNLYDGFSVWAGVVRGGSTLYGTTFGGGPSNGGVLFQVNTDGSGFQVLKTFIASEGAGPRGTLVLSGSTLYGSAAGGGASWPSASYGVIFKVNTDGSDYTVLKNFAGSDGSDPEASLVLGGSTLYGTTIGGGSLGRGVVFKVNTDGSGFAVLKNFADSDGMYPRTSLVLGGNTLYGTTGYGGSSDLGVVFSLNIDGSGFTVLKSFTGSDGSAPFAGLLLSGNTLYGTTVGGGTYNAGVVFSLTCLSIVTPPLTHTAEVGTTAELRVEAVSPTPSIGYQWFFCGTNALPGATNALLQLPNVQPLQAGPYTVVVTNLGFAITSAPAMLGVIPPVERKVVPALSLTGDAGNVLHVEYSDSLATPNWFALSDVTLSDRPQFCFDISPELPQERFYRAWVTTGPQPALGANMANEITLTGTVGSSVRVDYINAIGPIDAWVTLDTVLLTNSSHTYFDVTAFHQPTRLYRIIPLP